MNRSDEHLNPFPGPRPFGVEDGTFFFGREREIDEIAARIRQERLTIVAGSSGVGKTSLIAAGVVWKLLQSRRDSTEPSGAAAWPVLLLRDWGGALDVAVEVLFRSQLRKAIENLNQSDWAPADYERLKPALEEPSPERDSFFDDVVYLCNLTGGGIIIVLDQFEEVLRAGEELANEAVKIVETLFRFERRARLLVSLRVEYHRELHSLESYVGGVYGRTYFLKPMVTRTVEDAVLQSAQEARVQIGPQVIADILGWLQQAGTRYQRDDLPVSDRQAIKDEPVVDLLTVQAIFRELLQYCWSQSSSSQLQIDSARLDDFMRSRLTPQQWEGRSQQQRMKALVSGAMERWIEDALRMPALPKQGRQPPIYVEASDGSADSTGVDRLTGYVRRLATRMAPFLSSGGYKVAAEQIDLMFGTLRRDLERLCQDIDNIDRRLWIPEMEENIPRLNRQALGLSEEFVEFNLSGLALEKKWSYAVTAEQLVAVYLEAQRRLEKGNILKPIRFPKGVVWELTHDGLGNPLTRLADRQRESWDDAVHSLTATRGSDIVLSGRGHKNRQMRNLCWQGCWIYLRQGAELDGFVFSECNLQGTVFFGTTFAGGLFDRCEMEGSLFLNCDFKLGSDGSPLTFKGCTANGMAFLVSELPEAQSLVEGLRFEGCDFSQVKLSRLQLNGPITIGGDSRLFLCDFAGLSTGPEAPAGAGVYFEDDSRIEFCAWDRVSKPLINMTPGCDLLSSGVRHERD